MKNFLRNLKLVQWIYILIFLVSVVCFSFFQGAETIIFLLLVWGAVCMFGLELLLVRRPVWRAELPILLAILAAGGACLVGYSQSIGPQPYSQPGLSIALTMFGVFFCCGLLLGEIQWPRCQYD